MILRVYKIRKISKKSFIDEGILAKRAKKYATYDRVLTVGHEYLLTRKNFWSLFGRKP